MAHISELACTSQPSPGPTSALTSILKSNTNGIDLVSAPAGTRQESCMFVKADCRTTSPTVAQDEERRSISMTR